MFKAKTDTRFRPKIVIITVTVGGLKTQKEGVIFFFFLVLSHTLKKKFVVIVLHRNED